MHAFACSDFASGLQSTSVSMATAQVCDPHAHGKAYHWLHTGHEELVFEAGPLLKHMFFAKARYLRISILQEAPEQFTKVEKMSV